MLTPHPDKAWMTSATQKIWMKKSRRWTFMTPLLAKMESYNSCS